MVTRCVTAFHMMKHEVKSKLSPKRKLYLVQSLDRALDILECFSFQNRESSLAGIAQHTGLNKTTGTTSGFKPCESRVSEV